MDPEKERQEDYKLEPDFLRMTVLLMEMSKTWPGAGNELVIFKLTWVVWGRVDYKIQKAIEN